MYEAAASRKEIARASVTNWEPRGVTLAGYYAVRYGMKVQLVTPYRVTHLQRYEVTLRGNVTSVCSARNSVSCHSLATLRGCVTRQRYKCVPTLRRTTGRGTRRLLSSRI